MEALLRPGGPSIDGDDTTAERMLFIHVMKTAGTSMRQMLDRELGFGGVYPNDFDLTKLPKRWYPKAQEIIDGFASLPPHRILIGHFPAALRQALPAPYIPVAFVRDPLQRSASMIEHRRRLWESGDATAEQVLEDRQFVETQVRDYQTKVFGMDIGVVNTPWPTDDTTLAKALERLSELDFVGLTEELAASCEIFDRMYGTATSRTIRRANVGRPTAEVPTSLARRIAPYIERDVEFYQAAVAQHRRQVDFFYSRRFFDMASGTDRAAGQRAAVQRSLLLWPRGREVTPPPEVPTPVFVGGTGRSGTTILAKLLDAHSDCRRIGIEVRFISDQGGIVDLVEGRTSLGRFKRSVSGRWWHRTISDGSTRGLYRAIRRQDVLAAIEDLDRDFAADPWGAARAFVHRVLDPVATHYGARSWVEDTPVNIGAARGITEMLPEARQFHIIRDGRDVACSVVPLAWGPNDIDEALDWWAATLLDAHEASRGLPQLLTIRMEDLVATRREETYAAVLEHLGWADDPQMRRFFAEEIDAERARIGRWEAEVPEERKEAFNAHYDRLVARLGAAGVPTFA